MPLPPHRLIAVQTTVLCCKTDRGQEVRRHRQTVAAGRISDLAAPSTVQSSTDSPPNSHVPYVGAYGMSYRPRDVMRCGTVCPVCTVLDVLPRMSRTVLCLSGTQSSQRHERSIPCEAPVGSVSTVAQQRAGPRRRVACKVHLIACTMSWHGAWGLESQGPYAGSSPRGMHGSPVRQRFGPRGCGRGTDCAVQEGRYIRYGAVL